MSDKTAHTADLFEIIKTTRSMRRLKPDPVPSNLIRQILEAGVSGSASITSEHGTSRLHRDIGPVNQPQA